jgi:diguanylate cyclase (GGDEF)-like protein
MTKVAARDESPLTLAYLDIDHFKEVNDTLGHQAGDELLKKVASVIAREIRPLDMVGRLGGDEFGILVTDTEPPEAEEILKRIWGKLTESMVALEKDVTFSIGAIAFANPPVTVGNLLEKADRAMYSVKNSGRNGLQFVTTDGN